MATRPTSSLSGVPTDGSRCLTIRAVIAAPIEVRTKAPRVQRMSRPIMVILLKSSARRRDYHASRMTHPDATVDRDGDGRRQLRPGDDLIPWSADRVDRSIPDRFAEIV